MPMRAADLALALAPREGERTQTVDGRTIAVRSNRAWRELAESAVANAISAEAEAAAHWKARDAAQARANNAELESKRWLAAFDRQLERFNALHAEHAELVAAVATVARFAAKESGK